MDMLKIKGWGDAGNYLRQVDMSGETTGQGSSTYRRRVGEAVLQARPRSVGTDSLLLQMTGHVPTFCRHRLVTAIING